MSDYNVPILSEFSWQGPVEDKDLTTPAGGESKGDRYIVKATAAGDWTGHATHIAMANQDTPSEAAHWIFATPLEGWLVYIKDEDKIYLFNGSAWVSEFNFNQLKVQGNNIITSISHGGKKEHFAGNNGMGQSQPAYVDYEPEAAVTGSRDSDTQFTGPTGAWVTDALIGQYCYSYVNGSEEDGIWLEITANDTMTLTVDGVLYAAADRVITSVWNPIQHEYTHGKGAGAYTGAAYDGESVWLCPHDSDYLTKVNPSDGSMTHYNITGIHNGNGSFKGIVYDGKSLWLVPRNSDFLVKVDPADGGLTSYDITAIHNGDNSFAGGVFDGKYIWLAPYSSDDLVKVDPADGSMTSYAHGQGASAFVGAAYDGQYIWLAPSSAANLVRVNPADGSMTTYAHGQVNIAFTGICFDGENLWLIPQRSSKLIKVNPADGSMTTYTHNQNSDLAIAGACYDGESIWLAPFNGDYILKINPADGSIIEYPHGQGAGAFAGTLFDGESVWCIPYGSTNLIAFVPPRFGRPSLHTAGPINAASAKIGDGTNYLEVKEDGEIALHGTARTVAHVEIDAAAMRVVGGSHGEAGAIAYANFRNAQDDEVYFTSRVPYRRAAGADLSITLRWYYTGGNDNADCEWNLTYNAVKAGEDPTAAGTALAEQAIAIATDDTIGEVTFTIPSADLEADDSMGIKIWRDGSDALTADARLIDVHIHFIKDKLGLAT